MTLMNYKCSNPSELNLDKIIRVKLDPDETNLDFSITPANYGAHIKS